MELKELSQAARASVQSQSITGEWDYASFGELLQQLLAFDTVRDKRVAFQLSAMVACVIVALVGTIVGIILMDNYVEVAGQIVLAIGLLAIVGAIAFGVLRSRAKRGNLTEASLKSLLQLFRMIYRDLHPNGKVQARIDLSGLTDAKRGPLQALPQAGFLSRSQAIYYDPWCQIRFRLSDGYVVSLRQTDRVTELLRTRRNARGKQKTKARYTKLCRVTVTLLPPEPVQFAVPPPLDPKWERVRAGTKKGRTVAVWDRWFCYKEKFSKPAQTPSGAELAWVLLRVCSIRPRT